ncbi:hypothetical protein BDZ91DRAFT_388458 [Kalaharituber pfeilii]|nr:hypothetical protein BDZ91DRAFT_388458 [Kalaharituber pfeilii]
MMEPSLDLSPVISLLQALSPVDKSPDPPMDLQRVPQLRNPPRLGDFTSLWNFLGHEPITGSVTPASVFGLPSRSLSASCSPSLDLSGSEPDDHDSNSGTPLSEVLSPTPPPTFVVETLSQTPRRSRKRVLYSKGKFSQLPPLYYTPTKSLSSEKQPLNHQSPQFQFSKEVEVTIAGETVSWEDRPTIEANIPLAVRRINLINKLMLAFPQDKDALMNSRNTNNSSKIHVFIDNSNIIIGFIELLKKLRGFKKNQRIRNPSFSFHHLSLILERGRPIARRVLVGSKPVTPVIEEANSLKYECNILAKIEKEAVKSPRSRKGSSSTSSGSDSSTSSKTKMRMRKAEQAVDEVLNMKILESLLDYSEPGIIVLASGDGAIGEFSDGFFKAVQRALMRGWTIELVTFSSTMSKSYTDKKFCQHWKNQFRVILLDPYVEELLG